jgi:hypothetical protein
MCRDFDILPEVEEQFWTSGTPKADIHVRVALWQNPTRT